MRKLSSLFGACALSLLVCGAASAQGGQASGGNSQPAKKGLFGKIGSKLDKAGQKIDKAASSQGDQAAAAKSGGAQAAASRDNAGASAPLGGQSSSPPQFKEGDRVEVDTTHVDVQHGGNPAFQSWSKGTITKVDTQYQRYVIQLDPLPGKLPVMHSIPMYDQDCCIRPFGGAAPTIKTDTLRVDENGTVLADRPLLDCDNLQHNGRNGQPLPVELAKKLIRCLYEKPSPVGQDGATKMDIVEFSPGAPRKWILYQDQGQGALDTIVYPVHVKYNVETFYRGRDAVITGKEMTFTCFADKQNLWQCGFASGPNKEGKKEDILVKLPAR